MKIFFRLNTWFLPAFVCAGIVGCKAADVPITHAAQSVLQKPGQPAPAPVPPAPVVPAAQPAPPALQPPGQVVESPKPVVPAPPVPAAAPPTDLGTDVIAWDSLTKEDHRKSGEAQAMFTFFLTNVSSDAVVVHAVSMSCGCTTAHMPPMPWTLPAGTNTQIDITMNLAGKSGTVFKTVTVSTDKGNKMLTVKTVIEPPPAPAMGTREQNMETAKADRQAVFKGDCAKCHGHPATDGKMGEELYKAACGVCHDSEHRATAVPDLKKLTHPANAEFWKFQIVNGKPGTMMPGFSETYGGPLSDEQIHSLTDYLVQTIPEAPAAPAAPAAPPAPTY